MPPVLDIQRVSKSFGDLKAVQDLDLSVEAGSVFGLLGPNGAGKSTTIRMIMDIIKPDAGTIQMLGESSPDRRRDRIGYLPEERGLYRKMKILDMLVYLAKLHGVETSRARKSAMHWLDRFELAAWADSKNEALSKGMQQKVQIVATILHEPEVVILDEPFSGLDPVNVDLVKAVMLELRDKGTTILLSTHQMEVVEKLCDSICLINHGRSMLNGSLKKVKSERWSSSIQIEYAGRPTFHKDTSLIARQDDSGRYMELTPAAGVTTRQVLEAAIREIEIRRFQVMEPSLHQIFVETVQAQEVEV